jgi:hypothetical protein
MTLSQSNQAALNEESRLSAIQAAADKAAADKAAAEKLAAEQAAAAAAEASRLASLPVVKSSLVVKPAKGRKIAISIAAPTGSTTIIQRKVGAKWKTVLTTTTVPSMITKVSKVGTYRVKINIPTGTITTKSYKIK